MKRSAKAIIGGFCLATILISRLAMVLRAALQNPGNFHLTNDDLNYLGSVRAKNFRFCASD